MAKPKPALGPDEYLAWEPDQPDRNEYVDGEVFAMGGASDAHGTVALNLAARLLSALKGTPCKPFIADMKVHVETANCFFYPDIVVTCDARDRGPEASHVKRHPVLVVEVLSPSTEAYDRGGKFAAYRQLAALQEYALVSPESRCVEVFRRDDTGHWVLYPFAVDDQLELASVGFSCPVAELFEGLDEV